jgi:hypothetical protein
MSVLIGVWFALAGGMAALAGLTAMRRVRQLRRAGSPAWALAVPSPTPPDNDAGGSPRRTLIQYALADGRVVERSCPASGLRATSLRPGQKVLIWYDQKDPEEILVYGRDGRHANIAFVLFGVALMLAGCCIATLSH